MSLPFVGRESEIRQARTFLNLSEYRASGSTLVVRGDSGTGKTTFIKKVLSLEVAKAKKDPLCLYIDLSNDEFRSSQLLSNLLTISLVSGAATEGYPTNVPLGASYGDFKKKYADRRREGMGFLRTLAHALGAFAGFRAKKAVEAALGSTEEAGSELLEAEVSLFLHWVSQNRPVAIAIDNVQFLNLETRLTLESILQRVGSNIRLVCIDRTIEGESELDLPVRCFEKLITIDLDAFSESETGEVIFGALDIDEEAVPQIAADIFSKTGGVAKDLEFCLRRLAIGLSSGSQDIAVEGLITSIDKLPLIYRQFLIVATLLDGGVWKELAKRAISRVAFTASRGDLEEVVVELVSREYLELSDSEQGELIRPGHERVVQAVRELAEADEELQNEVRRSLVDEFIATWECGEVKDGETYLLHCLIGLQTAEELARNLHYISMLARSQYRVEQFAYLATLAVDIYEILPLLPEEVLSKLLDAMQKNSSFDKGLELVRFLRRHDSVDGDKLLLFEFKFLTQLYQYEDALQLSGSLPMGPWATIYRLNILMALDRFDEAKKLASLALDSAELSEPVAVILRNTVTLFPSEVSLRNLQRARSYFNRSGSRFKCATVDTNKSLVYLNMGALGDAARVLDRAISNMSAVGSNEIYQAFVNLGLRYAAKGRYGHAISFMRKASLRIPRTLLLDLIKVEMNSIVLMRLAYVTPVREMEESLQKSLDMLSGVNMPYLRQALNHNISMCRALRSDKSGLSAQGIPGYASDFVTLMFPLSDTAAPKVEWLTLLSVHWRY
ncbi:MAG: AAA family ATPase [Acidobacteriota bacterium]